MNKIIFDRFNEFINSFEADASEVCVFIYSLLCENGYKDVYHPTGMYGPEYVLNDKEE